MVVAPHPEPDTDITLPYYHDNGHPVWGNIPVKLSSMASTPHTTSAMSGRQRKFKILTPRLQVKTLSLLVLSLLPNRKFWIK